MNHGRDIEKDGGLDCLGLIFFVYRQAGLSVDELDLPYGCRDQHRPGRIPLALKQIARQFSLVAAKVPAECRDGDVLLIGEPRHNHFAVVINGCCVEMTEKRLRVHRMARVWGFVNSVWRHKTLA